MKNIYILLIRSNTSVSRAINLMTGAQYTHASIAYDEELKSLCSFARRNTYTYLPAGLIHEDLRKGSFARYPTMPCALLRLPVPDIAYERIRNKLERMLSEKESYRYFIRGLISCRLGIESHKDKHYFCSHFVSHILETEGDIPLPKPPSLMHPQDLLTLPGTTALYTGDILGLIHWLKLNALKNGATVQ
ncbi:MAG: hypothetical protein IIW34_08105 [Clostridia bacterium]|nr:hypothetical protein [Clostridia bacterium]